MSPTVTTSTESPTAGATPLLECRSLVAGFGANQVLHGVDLEVPLGAIVGVFGLNGAGKSVTMKTVNGLVPLWSGTILLDGVDLGPLSPEARVAAGLGNVPQGRQVFPDLTIEENLRIGAYTTRRSDRSRWQSNLDDVYGRFPVLAARRSVLAGTLSGGQQASLAVGRALVNRPRLLLIDEPSAGLAPAVVSELRDILLAVADSGMTMLLIEQNVRFGLSLADSAAVMQSGRIVYRGSTRNLDRDRLATLLGIGRMLSDATADIGHPRPDRSARPGRRNRRRRPLVAAPDPGTPT